MAERYNRALSQSELFETNFQTARPSRPVFCHQEFLDKLAERRNDPIAKRTSLLMQRIAVDIARLHYKGTNGVNRGWRRSRLGGRSGSHFYAWWAPAGAAPLQGETSFKAADDHAVFLRDIRHHDDHAPLEPGSFANDYLPLSVSDLRGGEYAPEPWTAPQIRFAKSHASARILKGHPGSGKTTALLHAADASQAERVLYLTFSPDLAALARNYFDRFCSGQRSFTVLTYSAFLQQIVGAQQLDGTHKLDTDAAAGRARFRNDVQAFKRTLGPWASEFDALYDEIHAHLVGAAMPETCGRFPKAERLRLPDAAYRLQRTRYLGAATNLCIEAVQKLEKTGEGPVADRYFPDLAIAWRAAQSLVRQPARDLASQFDYGCIAVDEVQDLTPLEAFVVVKLASRLKEAGKHAQLLLAGDEAQTVRPTDFEWAWLNDMLHTTLSQPQEFKLPVNLRCPRRIANLVNRTWDLYDFLDKQDRPSGAGSAEIDDDSPDQIIYAALSPPDLPALLQDLAQREGLALIAFNPAGLPSEIAPFVLSPSEAKGLDFHSVCVLNGGALLRRIGNDAGADVTRGLHKRLAIDQLRVVLSRPTERLIWLDAAPDAVTVQAVGRLLSSASETALLPISAEALRASLNEDELEIEERIQRCQRDARQLIAVKPDLAWSRAHQAIALLGTPGDFGAVTDRAVRELAYMTLAEVCFLLGYRKQNLSPEFGHPDLFAQAAEAARSAGQKLLASALWGVGTLQSGDKTDRLNRIAFAIQAVSEAHAELPAWLLVAITPKVNEWIAELEENLAAGDNPVTLQRILPPFFDALNLPDAAARKDRLVQRVVQVLMKNRKYAQALPILQALPAAEPKLIAECYKEMGEWAKAAGLYRDLGDLEKALQCFRLVPDFGSALQLVRQMETHSARPALEWLSELDALLERRPGNFNRVMTPPEKKLLESMMERALGVQRKKPAVKKAPAKKAAAPKPRKRPPPKAAKA